MEVAVVGVGGVEDVQYDERSVGGNVVQGDNEEFELGSGFGNKEWAKYAVR